MNTFYISDNHWNHRNIIFKVPRPTFDSVEYMNEYMIDKWNSVVSNEDTVYHLGDFAFGPKDVQANIYSKLNGNKILILGNHDGSRTRMKDIGFKEIYKKLEIHSSPQYGPILLIHDPNKITEENLKTYEYILYGHLHEKIYKRKNCISVCVEKIDYTPQTLKELICKNTLQV